MAAAAQSWQRSLSRLIYVAPVRGAVVLWSLDVSVVADESVKVSASKCVS